MKKTLCAILAGLALSSEGLATTNLVESLSPVLVTYRKTDNRILDRARLYLRAAEKRRSAAEAQENLARKNSDSAAELESTYDPNIKTRGKNYLEAGNFYIQSGDLLISASKNYISSFSNTALASKLHDKLQIKDNEKLEKSMEQDNQKAQECYNEAIEKYVSAADCFSSLNGDSPKDEAKANEKASIFLEFIASEK